MRHLKAQLAALVLAVSLPYPVDSIGAPEAGWWWNPAESGRGYFIESSGEVTFIGAYLYEADGHATWLVAGGSNADPYNYTGPLYSTKNGQTLLGPYVAPAGPDTVGTISVHFHDDTHGTLTWPGGTVAIERYAFGSGAAEFQPDQGWWWNPNESGSGYSIEIQGDKLFFVGYMYDASGRPVWYLSAGTMSSFASYSGDLLQFGNGQTLAGPYHPPGAPVSAGGLKIEFAAADTATLTFSSPSAPASSFTSNGARPLAAPGTVRETVVETLLKKQRDPSPKAYLATFFVQELKQFGGGLTTLTWSGKSIFKLQPDGGYTGTDTLVIVNATSHHDVLPTGWCDLAGVGVFQKRNSLIASGLEIDRKTGAWDGGLDIDIDMPYTLTCTVPSVGSSSGSGTEVVSFGFDASGQQAQDQVPTGYANGAVTTLKDSKGALWAPIKRGTATVGYASFAPL